MKKGIDVSTWQSNINYENVKNDNIEFAIIRCGYGQRSSQKDNQFEKHYAGFKNVGIPVGAYHYSYASTVEGAKKEAYNCLEFIKGKNFDLPIFYDLEDNTTVKASRETITEMAKAFCDILIEHGYKAGIYANLNWFNNKMNIKELEKYYIWLAQWNDKITANFKVDYWQYTSKGSVNGISGNVDMDYQVKAEEQEKPIEPSKKSIEELAQEVIAGKWGNGHDRVVRLTNAGYNYNEVQNRVNEILGYGKQSDPLYYVIKWGDTLTKISNKFGVSINQLMSWNNIKNANKIYAGQKIRVK